MSGQGIPSVEYRVLGKETMGWLKVLGIKGEILC